MTEKKISAKYERDGRTLHTAGDNVCYWCMHGRGAQCDVWLLVKVSKFADAPYV